MDTKVLEVKYVVLIVLALLLVGGASAYGAYQYGVSQGEEEAQEEMNKGADDGKDVEQNVENNETAEESEQTDGKERNTDGKTSEYEMEKFDFSVASKTGGQVSGQVQASIMAPEEGEIVLDEEINTGEIKAYVLDNFKLYFEHAPHFALPVNVAEYVEIDNSNLSEPLHRVRLEGEDRYYYTTKLIFEDDTCDSGSYPEQQVEAPCVAEQPVTGELEVGYLIVYYEGSDTELADQIMSSYKVE
jgi:hypothetical protein